MDFKLVFRVSLALIDLFTLFFIDPCIRFVLNFQRLLELLLHLQRGQICALNGLLFDLLESVLGKSRYCNLEIVISYVFVAVTGFNVLVNEIFLSFFNFHIH